MRILHIHPSMASGGIESMICALSNEMSKLEDVDMAKEMTTFTSQNVITQAANSMLAQANQMPEKVLQLLQ